MNSQTPDRTNTPLRLAVFDCDGTLVDSGHSIVACMQAACTRHDLKEPEPDAIRRMVGLPLEEAVSRLFPELDHDTVWSVREGYREVFMGLRERGEVHEPLYDGALEVIDQLDQAGWLLGVATGKAMVGLVNTLGGHDLESRFVTLQTADKAMGKPNPEMLFNAMNETGVEAHATVMIGDTTYDMEMARNAGTLAVGVSWGYHPVSELTDAGAHVVVHSYGDLPAAIDDLMEG